LNLKKGNLTEGNIWKLLVFFAVPMLLGNLLQQFYNAVDAVVVGRYVGPEALAAVGVTGPMINMIVALFMGISSGSTVIIARFFGAKEDKGIEEAVHNAMLLAVTSGIALSIAGVLLCPAMLRLMSTPADMFEGAKVYLTIYFAGLTGLTVYNMGAAVLIAVGDSKRPLYFLMLATVLNTVGDLVFVRVFKLGIAGVAYATIISQAICASLVVILLCRAKGAHRLVLKRLRFSGDVLGKIAGVGLPAGIQQSIIGASNTIVMGYVNTLGIAVSAGYAASNKLDMFIMVVMQSMALAVTTFVSQNLGAGNVARARRGVVCSLIMGVGVTACLSALALIFHTALLRIFSPDMDVIGYGWEFMRVFVPFYFLLGGTQIIPGALRGAGDVKVAVYTNVFCMVVLRQIYLFVVTRLVHNVFVVALSFPIMWFISALVTTVYYMRTDWSVFEKPRDEREKIIAV
jgi:putative MATE family efflux protein